MKKVLLFITIFTMLFCTAAFADKYNESEELQPFIDKFIKDYGYTGRKVIAYYNPEGTDDVIVTLVNEETGVEQDTVGQIKYIYKSNHRIYYQPDFSERVVQKEDVLNGWSLNFYDKNGTSSGLLVRTNFNIKVSKEFTFNGQDYTVGSVFFSHLTPLAKVVEKLPNPLTQVILLLPITIIVVIGLIAIRKACLVLYQTLLQA